MSSRVLARALLAPLVLVPGLLAGLAADPAAAAPRADPTSATGVEAAARIARPHVLVVGIDGLRLDVAERQRTPALHALMARGQTWRTLLYAPPFSTTKSGPGWSTNLTGTWPDKHKIKDNDWGASGDVADHPDVLTRVERARPELSTYAAAGWPDLTSGGPDRPVISSAVDTRVSYDGDADGWTGTDARVADAAVTHLRGPHPDASFVYFGAVDEAGHECGAAHACYADAIRRTDAHLGRLMRVVAERRARGETWTVLLTTDHGHKDAGGHGGVSPHERASFLTMDGAGAYPGQVSGDDSPVRNVDLVPTVLRQLGVPAPADLDGRPLTAPDPDPFDALTATVAGGATHEAPPGWDVDDAAMGTGGDARWRGWAFTGDARWSAAQRYQGRGGNVRERGTFAVADSDEWADAPHTGRFDSTLRSPSYDVGGHASAVVRFASHYKGHADQAGQLAVSFDGGPAQVVRTWRASRPHTIEHVPVAVPAGAERMSVQWRLTGAANGWYWAVDEPSVTPTG
ncbi:alkaline phosphatase family protein [Marmoricola endophyticus]|nr:alkaline phosphatase family protein [Marmoricola endophyticus]